MRIPGFHHRPDGEKPAWLWALVCSSDKRPTLPSSLPLSCSRPSLCPWAQVTAAWSHVPTISNGRQKPSYFHPSLEVCLWCPGALGLCYFLSCLQPWFRKRDVGVPRLSYGLPEQAAGASCCTRAALEALHQVKVSALLPLPTLRREFQPQSTAQELEDLGLRP